MAIKSLLSIEYGNDPIKEATAWRKAGLARSVSAATALAPGMGRPHRNRFQFLGERCMS